MWDELSVERAATDAELATAVAGALGVERAQISIVATLEDAAATAIVLERRTSVGDFALRIGIYGAIEVERVAFYRRLAATLSCKLLVSDAEIDPYTAMLVTPDGSLVRVNLDVDALDGEDQAIVIAGLYEHVDPEAPAGVPVPAPVPGKRALRSRGAVLAQTVNDYLLEGARPAPRDRDAFAAAYTPEVQDAEHAVATLLRALGDRKSTDEDVRALGRAIAILRRAFPDLRAAGGFLLELVRCADDVIAEAPWDPDRAV